MVASETMNMFATVVTGSFPNWFINLTFCLKSCFSSTSHCCQKYLLITLAILLCMQWYFAPLFCIFLMANEDEN